MVMEIDIGNKPTYEELVKVLIEHLMEIAQEKDFLSVEDTAFGAEVSMINILCRLDILNFRNLEMAFWNYENAQWGDFIKSIEK